MRRKLPRRTMLRGLLGGSAVAVGLPALEIFLDENGTAHADGSAFPRRFGVWFWGNGVWAPGVWSVDADGNETPTQWDWHPSTGTGPEDFALTDQLAALERHRDVLAIISGTDIKTGSRFPHTSGACGVLSGASPEEVEPGHIVWPLPTIDQIIADGLGAPTLFRSIETSAVIEPDSFVSHRGPDARNPVESSPYAIYQRIFGASFRQPGDASVVDAAEVGLRRSVLDAVMGQSQRLRHRLGNGDRVRLDRHFAAVRDLEVRLGRLLEDPPVLDACVRPGVPPEEIADDERGRQQVGVRNELMGELLAMALACDQTRVFSHLFSNPVGNTRLPIDGLELFGVLEGHHTITHDEPRFEAGESTPLRRVHDIMVWIFGQLATFVDKLRAIEEGDGTLLDHMCLLATTDTSNPRGHWVTDFPIFTFGSADGRLRTGVHLRSSSDNAAAVGLSLIRAVGLPAPSFGAGEGYTEDGFAPLER